MNSINIWKLLLLLFITILLPACGSSGSNDQSNSAPGVSGVIITDNNGNNAVIGDILTGNYIYSDAEGDVEGTSTFRWLRNDIAISGATSITYTLLAADTGQTISFEVTPVAATGTRTGNAVTSAGIHVVNFAPSATNVSITDDNGGIALVGDNLTGTYIYSDAEGDVEGTSTFRWLRNGIAISGAITPTYTLVTADNDQAISFEVSPVAASGTSTGNSVTSSIITVNNSAPTASGITISDTNGGDAVVGDNLAGSYIYSDIEGDSEGTSTFRWLRNGVAISGATTPGYTLTAIDSSQAITFEVTPVATTGTVLGNATTSSGITILNSTPTASNVSITDNNGNNTVVEDRLTGHYTYTDVDGDTEGTSTFRWLRNEVAISGATARSYTLVAADSGQTITFEVTPIANTGSNPGNSMSSSGISVINSAPLASNVNITDGNGGIALVDDTLTGNYTYSDVDEDTEGTSTFRWLRNGIAISGATASTYTLVTADNGQAISFEVTPVATSGTSPGNPVTSSIITVNNSVPIASNISITDNNGGNVLVNDTLTGTYSYSDFEGDTEGISTFRWLRNGVAINGATAATYTLIATDSGKTISFEVTPVATTGTTLGNPATSSSITVTNSEPIALTQIITINEDSPAIIHLGTDADADNLTNTITVAPGNGVLSGTSEHITYTPNQNYNGSDTFSFTLNDGTVDSSTETITIIINAINDAPVANNDTINTSAGKTDVNSTLTATDIENDSLSFTILSSPTQGNIILTNANTGDYTYTPATLATDSFTFKVTDSNTTDARDSNVATITINPPAALSTPNAPVNVTALAGDQRITLNWDPVDYAESYRVYWGPSTGVTTSSGTQINVSKPYFYHDSITNNTPYYYIITALNTNGESMASSEATATPIDVAISNINFTDSSLNNCVADAATNANAIYVHELINLNCESRNISNLTGIEQLTNLRSLILSSNNLTDILRLANLTQLNDLHLDNNTINGDIQSLADLNNITKLIISNTDTTDISPLANMSNMTTLYLDHNNISDITPIADMTSLTQLVLTDNYISDISPISAMTNLTILDLRLNQISDISSLPLMPSLTSLFLLNNNIFDISPLLQAPNLEILHLRDNNIYNVDTLSGLNELNFLALENNNIYNVSAFSGLTNLTTLFLATNQIVDVSPLATLVNLETLILQNNNIGGKAIGQVDKLITLTAATDINLTVNTGMSCSELNTLINTLGAVVLPIAANPGVNCTAP